MKGRGSRQLRQTEQNRHEVAAEAARIIATEGQRNYATAKQKAAHRLGVTNRKALPSNVEIETALKQWQQLFGGEALTEHLRALRALALEAMAFFQAFKPKLVGPVLEGTADEFSRVCLHLFTDDPDAPVHHLMAQGIPFEQERRRIRWHRDTAMEVDALVLDKEGQLIDCTVMVGPDAKQAPPSPIDGKPMRRASRHELETLLANPPTG